ncbi:hypothetical protein [Parabacteroides sp.]|nr:hypothetical protein [Parabacteroides sp.]
MNGRWIIALGLGWGIACVKSGRRELVGWAVRGYNPWFRNE